MWHRDPPTHGRVMGHSELYNSATTSIIDRRHIKILWCTSIGAMGTENANQDRSRRACRRHGVECPESQPTEKAKRSSLKNRDYTHDHPSDRILECNQSPSQPLAIRLVSTNGEAAVRRPCMSTIPTMKLGMYSTANSRSATLTEANASGRELQCLCQQACITLTRPKRAPAI